MVVLSGAQRRKNSCLPSIEEGRFAVCPTYESRLRPLSALVISGLSPAQMAAAAGLSNFARITAGAFGASIAVTLWENHDIDVQAATLSATEFFWASGALFLVLSALALLAKPACPASGGSPV
jgi:hypothetical protein